MKKFYEFEWLKPYNHFISKFHYKPISVFWNRVKQIEKSRDGLSCRLYDMILKQMPSKIRCNPNELVGGIFFQYTLGESISVKNTLHPYVEPEFMLYDVNVGIAIKMLGVNGSDTFTVWIPDNPIHYTRLGGVSDTDRYHLEYEKGLTDILNIEFDKYVKMVEKTHRKGV